MVILHLIALVYEVLYKNVFGMKDVDYAVDKMLHYKPMRHRGDVGAGSRKFFSYSCNRCLFILAYFNFRTIYYGIYFNFKIDICFLSKYAVQKSFCFVYFTAFNFKGKVLLWIHYLMMAR